MIFKFEMQGKKSGHHRLGLLNLVLTSSCVNYQVLVKFGNISFVCETDSDKLCLLLMELTPGFNFINILCAAFMLIDPESVKIHS
jgi:hypothetical protein